MKLQSVDELIPEKDLERIREKTKNFDQSAMADYIKLLSQATVRVMEELEVTKEALYAANQRADLNMSENNHLRSLLAQHGGSI